MSRRLNLLYLAGNRTGGWATYTAHLMLGLSSIGVEPYLYTISTRTERKRRQFGFGMEYRNLSLEAAMSLPGPVYVTALHKNYTALGEQLARRDKCWFAVQAYTEISCLPKQTPTGGYIAIRQALADRVDGSVFIPHPYTRLLPAGTFSTNEYVACNISRVDFDKNTHVILDANRLLHPSNRVDIYGCQNNRYAHVKLGPNYPEWLGYKSVFPRRAGAAVAICNQYTLSVDLSVIKKDGGGTQYTFMEAMDAGSANVIHSEWLIPGDEMIAWPDARANCFAVGDSSQLAQLIETVDLAEVRRIVLAGNVLLSRHRPRRIAEMLATLVGA